MRLDSAFRMAALASLAGCLGTGIIALLLSRYDYAFVSVAIATSLLPLSIAAWRGAELFEPISLVALAVGWSASARAIYMVAGGPRADFLMMGQSWGEIAYWSILSFAGIGALCLGYILTKVRVGVEAVVPPMGRYSRDGYFAGVGLLTLLGFVGVALFIMENGIDLSRGLLALSVKRHVAIVGDDGSVAYGVGLPRVLSTLSAAAFVATAAYMIFNPRARNILMYSGVVGLALLAVAVPFLASSRGAVVVPIITVAMVAYYRRAFSIRHSILLVALVTIVVFAMGNLRSVNQTGSATDLDPFGSIVASGNGLDLARTSAIMNRADELNIRLHGSSYASLLVGFVPRSLWHGKPQISLGPWVKGTLFGQNVRSNGWPSGLIAEAYLNFGAVAVLPVMFLFGALLRVFYNSFSPWLGASLPFTLIYCSGAWLLSFGSLGLNFSQGILQAAQFSLPIIFPLGLALLFRDRNSTVRAAVPQVRRNVAK